MRTIQFRALSSAHFLDKAARALEILRGELPTCYQWHVIPGLRGHALARRSESHD